MCLGSWTEGCKWGIGGVQKNCRWEGNLQGGPGERADRAQRTGERACYALIVHFHRVLLSGEFKASLAWPDGWLREGAAQQDFKPWERHYGKWNQN